KRIDFPLNALSPTDKHEMPGGWDLAWRYSNLISGFQIDITMPEKLQPGPLAGQISYFAPVSLLLFFFLMFNITTLRSIDVHPMKLLLPGGGVFRFPPVAGLPGGSHLHSRRVPDLLDGVGVPGSQLPQPRSCPSLRSPRGRRRACEARYISDTTGMLRALLVVCCCLNGFKSARISSFMSPQSVISSVWDVSSVRCTPSRAACMISEPPSSAPANPPPTSSG